MNEHKLFASVALFRNLHDNNHDIYDVISEFIKAALTIKKQWSFTASEVKLLLSELYEFELPDAVIKLVLRNKLTKKGIITQESLNYVFQNSIDSSISVSIDEQIREQEEKQKAIIEELYSYIQIENNSFLTDHEKKDIFNTFRTVAS